MLTKPNQPNPTQPSYDVVTFVTTSSKKAGELQLIDSSVLRHPAEIKEIQSGDSVVVCSFKLIEAVQQYPQFPQLLVDDAGLSVTLPNGQVSAGALVKFDAVFRFFPGKALETIVLGLKTRDLRMFLAVVTTYGVIVASPRLATATSDWDPHFSVLVGRCVVPRIDKTARRDAWQLLRNLRQTESDDAICSYYFLFRDNSLPLPVYSEPPTLRWFLGTVRELKIATSFNIVVNNLQVAITRGDALTALSESLTEIGRLKVVRFPSDLQESL